MNPVIIVSKGELVTLTAVVDNQRSCFFANFYFSFLWRWDRHTYSTQRSEYKKPHDDDADDDDDACMTDSPADG
jgi:hypothetical protein